MCSSQEKEKSSTYNLQEEKKRQQGKVMPACLREQMAHGNLCFGCLDSCLFLTEVLIATVASFEISPSLIFIHSPPLAMGALTPNWFDCLYPCQNYNVILLPSHSLSCLSPPSSL